MDRSDHGIGGAQFPDFSARLRGLSRAFAKLSRERALILLKLPAGILLLLISVLLAFYAKDIALVQAEATWHRTHFPGQAVWEWTLGQKGFSRVSAPAEIHRFLRALPLSLDSAHSVWLENQAETIVVFQAPELDVLPLVYTRADKRARATKPSRSQWQPLGTGWPAFELALEAIEKMPRPQVVRSRPQRRFSDPRAIQY